MKIFKKMKKGFTLVELVVVIAVIAILAAVSVGAYFGVTESANNSRLEQEAKQVYTAIQTVSLAPNEHSSLSKDGLVITNDSAFETELEKNLGTDITVTTGTVSTVTGVVVNLSTSAYSVSPAAGTPVVYKTFEYYNSEVGGKKAVADVVTGDCKVIASTAENIPSQDSSESEPPDAPLYNDGWHLVTDVNELENNDQIIIAAKGYDVAMSTYQKPNNRGEAPITKNQDGTAILTNDVQPITLGKDGDKYTFETSAGYLYAANSEENYLRSYNELDDNGRWTIEINAESAANIKASGENKRNIIRYNDANTGKLFSAYASGQKDVVIYKNYGANIEEKEPSFLNIEWKDDVSGNTVTETTWSIDYPDIIKKYSNGSKSSTSKEDFDWTSSSTLIACNEDKIAASGSYGNETVTITAKLKEDSSKSLNFEITVNIQEESENPGELSEITFELGDNGTKEHKDGSNAASTYTEYNGTYTLNITGGDKMYPSSFDAKGNSCLKFGTNSAVGKMSFTVPNDVKKVILYAGKYKANTTKINVNGTAYTLTKNSNDGAYDEIEVDTSSTKTVSFTTVSGGVRAMLNTIVFIVSSN